MISENFGQSEDEKENQPIRKIRAKRCLFGKSDPGIVREMLQKELDIILKKFYEESTEKYEFDFKNEMPLNSPSSKFEWHPVSMCEVPKVYLQRRNLSNSENGPIKMPKTPRKPKNSPHRVSLRHGESPKSSPQPKIDQFIPSRRRSIFGTPSKSSKSKIANDLPASPLANEKPDRAAINGTMKIRRSLDRNLFQKSENSSFSEFSCSKLGQKRKRESSVF